MKQEQVPLNTIEKQQRVMCIVEINQIWVIDGKFGVSMKLLQVLRFVGLRPTTTLLTC